jgi:radical SAM superfamily enzyme YgiQ (UPF0313 family)
LKKRGGIFLKGNIGLVNYAIQSKGPVPSGLMLEGSAHIAGMLMHQRYQPKIYDFNNLQSVRKIAEQGKQEFFNWAQDFLMEEASRNNTKLWMFTLYANGFRESIKLAQAIKKSNPNATIIGGGPQVSWYKGEILNYLKDNEIEAFDALVQGKPDNIMGKIADVVYGKESINNVPGAIFLNNQGKIIENQTVDSNITTLPFVVYDPEVYLWFDKKIHINTLRTSIGCRHSKCRYCIQPRIDRKYSERKPEDVLKEMEMLEKIFGITDHRLADPNPDPQHLGKIVSGFSDRTKISRFAYGEDDRENNFEKELKHLVGLFLGIETLDAYCLEELRKTSDAKEYHRRASDMIKRAKEAGVSTIHANIAPIAGDTTSRMQEEVKRVLEINPDFITALPEFPLPHTPLYRNIIRKGDVSGIRIGKDFLRKMMLFELDLLRDSSTWPQAPWSIKVDGEYQDNPFAVTQEHFSGPLSEHGIKMVSDEIVHMAHMYYGSLSKDQEERRKQVLDFNEKLREIQTGEKVDCDELEKIVEKINSN